MFLAPFLWTDDGCPSKVLFDRTFVGRLVMKRWRVTVQSIFLPLVVLVELKMEDFILKFLNM